MTSGIRRREFIAGLGAGLGAGLFASPAIVRAEGPVVIRAGALKLIHSIAPYFYDQFVPAGYKIEVLPFETPTECKNAVVTKSVDFGAFGIAAALLGAAAGDRSWSLPRPATAAWRSSQRRMQGSPRSRS